MAERIAERWIFSLRRDCLDHLIAINDRQLRRVYPVRMLTITTRTEPISGLKRTLLENGLSNREKMEGRRDSARGWAAPSVFARAAEGCLDGSLHNDDGQLLALANFAVIRCAFLYASSSPLTESGAWASGSAASAPYEVETLRTRAEPKAYTPCRPNPKRLPAGTRRTHLAGPLLESGDDRPLIRTWGKVLP